MLIRTESPPTRTKSSHSKAAEEIYTPQHTVITANFCGHSQQVDTPFIERISLITDDHLLVKEGRENV